MNKKIYYLIIMFCTLQTFTYGQKVDSTKTKIQEADIAKSILLRMDSIKAILQKVDKTKTKTQKADSVKTIIPVLKEEITAQIMLGTQGIGANFRYVFNKLIAARVGGSIGQVSANNLFTSNGSNKTTASFSSIHALAEFFPYKMFRLVSGVAYLPKTQVLVQITQTEDQTVNGFNFKADEIGTLDITSNWGKFAPYLGIGIGRGVPKKKFNINYDLGLYYISSPTVTVVGTKRLQDNEPNAAIIQNNLKGYRFMPVSQISFNYKF